MLKKSFVLLNSFLLVCILSFASFPINENGKTQFDEGLINFVNSVKPAYSSNGESFLKFKTFLIGTNNLTTITPQGEALLSKTYQLFAANASDADIKIGLNQEFSNTMKYILENSTKDPITNIGENASITLFGGDSQGLNASGVSMRSEGGCKWYQIGCHLNNLWDWIVDHKDDIKTVLAIVAYVTMICYYSSIC